MEYAKETERMIAFNIPPELSKNGINPFTYNKGKGLNDSEKQTFLQKTFLEGIVHFSNNLQNKDKEVPPRLKKMFKALASFKNLLGTQQGSKNFVEPLFLYEEKEGKSIPVCIAQYVIIEDASDPDYVVHCGLVIKILKEEEFEASATDADKSRQRARYLCKILPHLFNYVYHYSIIPVGKNRYLGKISLWCERKYADAIDTHMDMLQKGVKQTSYISPHTCFVYDKTESNEINEQISDWTTVVNLPRKEELFPVRVFSCGFGPFSVCLGSIRAHSTFESVRYFTASEPVVRYKAALMVKLDERQSTGDKKKFTTKYPSDVSRIIEVVSKGIWWTDMIKGLSRFNLSENFLEVDYDTFPNPLPHLKVNFMQIKLTEESTDSTQKLVPKSSNNASKYVVLLSEAARLINTRPWFMEIPETENLGKEIAEKCSEGDLVAVSMNAKTYYKYYLRCINGDSFQYRKGVKRWDHVSLGKRFFENDHETYFGEKNRSGKYRYKKAIGDSWRKLDTLTETTSNSDEHYVIEEACALQCYLTSRMYRKEIQLQQSYSLLGGETNGLDHEDGTLTLVPMVVGSGTKSVFFNEDEESSSIGEDPEESMRLKIVIDNDGERIIPVVSASSPSSSSSSSSSPSSSATTTTAATAIPSSSSSQSSFKKNASESLVFISNIEEFNRGRDTYERYGAFKSEPPYEGLDSTEKLGFTDYNQERLLVLHRSRYESDFLIALVKREIEALYRHIESEYSMKLPPLVLAVRYYDTTPKGRDLHMLYGPSIDVLKLQNKLVYDSSHGAPDFSLRVSEGVSLPWTLSLNRNRCLKSSTDSHGREIDKRKVRSICTLAMIEMLASSYTTSEGEYLVFYTFLYTLLKSTLVPPIETPKAAPSEFLIEQDKRLEFDTFDFVFRLASYGLVVYLSTSMDTVVEELGKRCIEDFCKGMRTTINIKRIDNYYQNSSASLDKEPLIYGLKNVPLEPCLKEGRFLSLREHSLLAALKTGYGADALKKYLAEKREQTQPMQLVTQSIGAPLQSNKKLNDPSYGLSFMNQHGLFQPCDFFTTV